MRRNQGAFTLIELVIVIAILGILGALATSHFMDLRSDAASGTAASVADAMSSASSINFAAAAARGTGHASVVRVVSSAAPSSCDALATALMNGLPVAAFSITGSVANTCTAGASMLCSVSSTQAGSASATATLICTG